MLFAHCKPVQVIIISVVQNFPLLNVFLGHFFCVAKKNNQKRPANSLAGLRAPALKLRRRRTAKAFGDGTQVGKGTIV
jgi:hypothetical protein